MTLLDIRKLFVDHSGRYDLVTDTTNYADNGADFFITSGQRILDDMVDVSQTDMIFEHSLLKGTKYVDIQNIRSITRIWIVGDDSEKIMLERMALNDFKIKYREQSDEGLPRVYSLQPTRTQTPDGDEIRTTRILLGPTPETAYELRVEGRFYSHSLVNNDDVSFWSVEYPHTLVQAALYSMERFYRNTQGMRDHMEAIERDIIGIDFDEVEKMVGIRTTMADSFNERARATPKSFSK